MQQFLSVVLVLALLGAVWFLTRFAGRRGWPLLSPRGKEGQRDLECIERLSLGPQHSLYLIRVGCRHVLIGTHASGFESFSAGSPGRGSAPNEEGE